MWKKERFLGAKSRFVNCLYFLKKAGNGKLCKHNQERGRSSHGVSPNLRSLMNLLTLVFSGRAVDSHSTGTGKKSPAPKRNYVLTSTAYIEIDTVSTPSMMH